MTTIDGPVVECRGLARTYGRGTRAVVAVHGVGCVLEPGAQVAVTGPSGSGKTTLLHLLAGLDRPTAGQVTWPALDDEPRGKVAVVFQGPSLLPPLTVAENVALPSLIFGCPEAAARSGALDALGTLGLGDLADRLPDELSGGQAQRVAVARALATRPRLIVADEPTAHLDSAHASQVIGLLSEVSARTGAALLVATHDRAVAGRLPGRWVMRDGALREADS
ncbi:ABC transporter ATP-binding protein [Streptosporangiaceae bacterium NEAU-GS5]|nr:ABC transporter ATP-binding protein [Streptosporangiaceae bacterium NEAU-GS5]